MDKISKRRLSTNKLKILLEISKKNFEFDEKTLNLNDIQASKAPMQRFLKHFEKKLILLSDISFLLHANVRMKKP